MLLRISGENGGKSRQRKDDAKKKERMRKDYDGDKIKTAFSLASFVTLLQIQFLDAIKKKTGILERR